MTQSTRLKECFLMVLCKLKRAQSSRVRCSDKQKKQKTQHHFRWLLLSRWSFFSLCEVLLFCSSGTFIIYNKCHEKPSSKHMTEHQRKHRFFCAPRDTKIRFLTRRIHQIQKARGFFGSIFSNDNRDVDVSHATQLLLKLALRVCNCRKTGSPVFGEVKRLGMLWML